MIRVYIKYGRILRRLRYECLLKIIVHLHYR